MESGRLFLPLLVISSCYLLSGADGREQEERLITINQQQYDETTGFDQEMVNFLKKHGYRGAAVGVVHDGRLVYRQGYGQGRGGDQEAVTAESLLPISSLSKVLTAVAVLRLVEEGRLELDAPVFSKSGLLDDRVPLVEEVVDRRVYDITVRHLLQHTAGFDQSRGPLRDPLMNQLYLERGHGVPDIAARLGIVSRLMSPSDVIGYAITKRLDHAPGTQYRYSNLGYSILGRAVEKVTSLGYGAYVQHAVLDPLGMWHTRVGPHHAQDQLYQFSGPDQQQPEVRGRGQPPDPVTYGYLDSTLGWFSTVHDLARLVGALDGSAGLKGVLRPETLRLMMGQPAAPVSEHQEYWHGMGLLVKSDGDWWQLGDQHDSDVLLYHRGNSLLNDSPKSPAQPAVEGEAPPAAQGALIALMTSNRHVNVRMALAGLLADLPSSGSWPGLDLSVEDCADVRISPTTESQLVVHYQVAEHHIDAYTVALASRGYWPAWFNCYTLGQKTFFAVIFEKDQYWSPPDYLLWSGLTDGDLDSKVHGLLGEDGYKIRYLTSYLSHMHKGQARHLVFVTKEYSPGVVEYGWHKKSGRYQKTLQEFRKKNYVPIIQSVTAHKGEEFVTYMLQKLNGNQWDHYTGLSQEELRAAVDANALRDRSLTYLSSYTDGEGATRFSAVFRLEKTGTWSAHVQLTKDQLDSETQRLSTLGYRPMIIAGYELDSHLYFAAIWLKI